MAGRALWLCSGVPAGKRRYLEQARPGHRESRRSHSRGGPGPERSDPAARRTNLGHSVGPRASVCGLRARGIGSEPVELTPCKQPLQRTFSLQKIPEQNQVPGVFMSEGKRVVAGEAILSGVTTDLGKAEARRAERLDAERT